jgi:hypothetical protein
MKFINAVTLIVLATSTQVVAKGVKGSKQKATKDATKARKGSKKKTTKGAPKASPAPPGVLDLDYYTSVANSFVGVNPISGEGSGFGSILRS